LSSGIYIQKNLPVDEGCSVGPDEADGEEGNERVTEKGEKVVADALKQQPDHGHACKDAPRCLFVPPQHKIGNWKETNRLDAIFVSSRTTFTSSNKKNHG
jgi:hypothetical protein